MPSSTSFVVVSGVDVKEWMEKVPSVDRLRPDRCPHCHGAARPVGEDLNIWGHGVRERLFWGVFALGEPARAVTIDVRRFLCRRSRCGHTFTVLPRQGAAHRRYLLPTIVLALALWTISVDEISKVEIRCRLSPDKLLEHHTGWTSWPQLLRWAIADDLAALMESPLTEGMERGLRAERIALYFAGRGPPSMRDQPLTERVLRELRKLHQPTTRTRLRERLAVQNKRLGDALSELERLGRIQRTSDGWQI